MIFTQNLLLYAQVHRGGDVERALELYNAVIEEAPTYSDAYHLKVGKTQCSVAVT